MARLPKHPELHAIAKKLDQITFFTQPSEEASERPKMLFEQARAKNIWVMPAGDCWVVRFYLHGEVYTVGLGHGSAFRGMRFADMATLRFFDRRTPSREAPLTEARFNFSRRQAEHDLDNEPEAVALLDELDTYLTAAGLLVSPEQREAAAADKTASLKAENSPRIGRKLDTLQATVNKLEAEILVLNTAVQKLVQLHIEAAKQNSCVSPTQSDKVP